MLSMASDRCNCCADATAVHNTTSTEGRNIKISSGDGAADTIASIYNATGLDAVIPIMPSGNDSGCVLR